VRAHNINPWRRVNAFPFIRILKDKKKRIGADAVEKLLTRLGLGIMVVSTCTIEDLDALCSNKHYACAGKNLCLLSELCKPARSEVGER